MFFKRKPHWTKKSFAKMAKNRICTCYVIRCFNKEESFYKVGITSKTIKERYSGKNAMPYDYEIIHEVKGSARKIFKLEKRLHKFLKPYKYNPNLYFAGITECFTACPDLNLMIKFLKW